VCRPVTDAQVRLYSNQQIPGIKDTCQHMQGQPYTRAHISCLTACQSSRMPQATSQACCAKTQMSCKAYSQFEGQLSRCILKQALASICLWDLVSLVGQPHQKRVGRWRPRHTQEWRTQLHPTTTNSVNLCACVYPAYRIKVFFNVKQKIFPFRMAGQTQYSQNCTGALCPNLTGHW